MRNTYDPPLDVDEELDMVNSPDWARIVLRCVVSFTKLRRKLSPDGHPPLGGLALMNPKVPMTCAAKTCGW